MQEVHSSGAVLSSLQQHYVGDSLFDGVTLFFMFLIIMVLCLALRAIIEFFDK